MERDWQVSAGLAFLGLSALTLVGFGVNKYNQTVEMLEQERKMRQEERTGRTRAEKVCTNTPEFNLRN